MNNPKEQPYMNVEASHHGRFENGVPRQTFLTCCKAAVRMLRTAVVNRRIFTYMDDT